MGEFVILRVSKNPSNLGMTNYICTGDSFDSVWKSQKDLFEPGNIVTVQDMESMEYKVYEL